MMAKLTFDEFFSLFHDGVISIYTPLFRAESDELDSCGRYRCAVALGFDIVSNYLSATEVSLKFGEKQRWIKKCPSFCDQLVSMGMVVDDFENNSDIRQVASEFLDTINRVVVKNEFSSDYLGRSFEKVYGLLPTKNELGKIETRSTRNRRNSGVYFTPANMVELLVDYALGPILIKTHTIEDLLLLNIVDPAVGPGLFLVDCVRRVSSRICELDPSISELSAKRLVVENCIYGVDSDPLIVNVARTILCLESNGDASLHKKVSQRIKVGDSLLGLSLAGITSGKYDGHLNGFENILKKCAKYKNLNKFHRAHSDYFLAHINEISENDDFVCQSIYRPFSWEFEFPEVFSGDRYGFDVVISNPPWGKIKPNIKEFYSHISPATKEYQGEKLRDYVADTVGGNSSLWNDYIRKTKTYSRILGKSGIYNFQTIMAGGKKTKGDPDLYKYFMERIFEISASDARLGLIVPSSFILTEGAAGIRSLYLNNGRFERLYDFLNKKRLFQIHPMFRFLMLSYKKSNRGGILDAKFGLTELPDKSARNKAKRVRQEKIKFNYMYLKDVSRGIFNVPDIRSNQEKELLHKIYKQHRCLGDKEGALWNVRFVRELDMTNDSSKFLRSNQLKNRQVQTASIGKGVKHKGEIYRPLFEGKMVHQFDYCAKGYVAGQGRTAKWKPMGYSIKKMIPHYYVSERVYVNKRPEACYPRAGFCDVTGHANERTVLSAIIPGNVICGNKVPTCRFSIDDPRLHLIWVALANSFVIDWLIRRRVSTTINFFYWDQIPFPRVDPESNIGKILIEACAKLSMINEQHEEYNSWLEDIVGPIDKIETIENRDVIRAKIDACVASIYNLKLEEFSIILDDFSIVDRKQPSVNLDKSNITKDLALLFYSQLCHGVRHSDLRLSIPQLPEEIETLTSKVRMAKDIGAVGYMPTELVREMKFRV